KTFQEVKRVLKEDGNFITKIDMPGVNKDDIELNVNEHEIEVKVEKNDEAEYKDEKKGYHKIERKSFGFYRNIPLPEEIDTDNTTAKYDKGVLEIKAPKMNGDSSKKKININ
ncbi:MAG: Hsp20/alpha crystallin family protein, partial [Candidatus Woesearchaeota archaeon]